jgi:RHS repeat-associated protein
MVALAEKFIREANSSKTRTSQNRYGARNPSPTVFLQPKNRGPARKNRVLSTKYLDDETGLVSYTYRYYDPALGRWVNRDPIGKNGGRNLYGYVGNAVVGCFDPLGHVDYEPGAGDSPWSEEPALLELIGWMQLPVNAARYAGVKGFLSTTFGFDLDAALVAGAGPKLRDASVNEYAPFPDRIFLNIHYYSIYSVVLPGGSSGPKVLTSVASDRHKFAKSLLHEIAHHAADKAQLWGLKNFVPADASVKSTIDSTYSMSTDLPRCQYEGYFIGGVWEGIWPASGAKRGCCDLSSDSLDDDDTFEGQVHSEGGGILEY